MKQKIRETLKAARSLLKSNYQAAKGDRVQKGYTALKQTANTTYLVSVKPFIEKIDKFFRVTG